MSALGSQLFNIALMYWLLETTGSATIMGFVLTASLLPVAVLSIFSGAMVDRLPRKMLMTTPTLSLSLSLLPLNKPALISMDFKFVCVSQVADDMIA